MKPLVALLILLNLAYFAWSTVRNLDRPAKEPATSRSDVKLLEDPADAESQAAGAEMSRPVIREERSPPAAAAECYALGPFKSLVSLERIAQELSLRGIKFNRRVEQGRSAEEYWVYIPPRASRDAALELSRSLAERGVKDYYVVSVGGK